MNAKVEALGYEYLKRLVEEERTRIAAQDAEINKLHDLEIVRNQCLVILNEHESMLAEYEKTIDPAFDPNWFYTEPRYESELPISTRVKVVAADGRHHYAEGRKGSVVGYRCCPGAIFPEGWHYILFDDDTTIYSDPVSMPYVNRHYLEVIE